MSVMHQLSYNISWNAGSQKGLYPSTPLSPPTPADMYMKQISTPTTFRASAMLIQGILNDLHPKQKYPLSIRDPIF